MSLVIEGTCQMMIPDIDLLNSSKGYYCGKTHSGNTASEYTITRLPTGEEHSGKAESEYTIT